MTKTNKGFTLVEVMITLVVLIGLLVGMLSLSIYSFDLQETSRNTTLALNAARAKIEEIRNTAIKNNYDFAAIIATYNNTQPTFSVAPLDGIGKTTVSYVSGSGNYLIDITARACWRQKGGRVVGEATLNEGNFTDCINSPVQLATSLAKRK